jgi:hypothetical protein
MSKSILNVETATIPGYWFSNTNTFEEYTKTTQTHIKTIAQEIVWNGIKIIPTTYFHKVEHKPGKMVHFKSYIEEDREKEIPKKFLKAVEYLTFQGSLPWDVTKCISKSQLTDQNKTQNLLAFIFPNKILITKDRYSTSNMIQKLEDYSTDTPLPFKTANKKSLALLLKSEKQLSSHQKITDYKSDIYIMEFLKEFLKTMFDDDTFLDTTRVPKTTQEMRALGPKKAP